MRLCASPVLLLLLSAVLVSGRSCPAGSDPCSLGAWSSWRHCGRDGMRQRYRQTCCDGLRKQAKCIKDCAIQQDLLQESEPCGSTNEDDDVNTDMGEELANPPSSYPTGQCASTGANYDGTHYNLFGTALQGVPCVAAIFYLPPNGSPYKFRVRMKVQSPGRAGIAYNLHQYNTFDFFSVDVGSSSAVNECYISSSHDRGYIGTERKGPCPGNGSPKAQEYFTLEVTMFDDSTTHITFNNEHVVTVANVNVASRSVGIIVENDANNIVRFEPVEVYAMTCDIPEAPENGDVSYTGLYLDSVASYSCNNDYFLHGNHRRTCERGTGDYGTWSGDQPVCIVRGECPENPCLHGATCHYGNNITACECLAGFSGDICETTEEFLMMTDTRPYQPLSWYTPPPTHRIRKSCFIKVVLEGLPYASVVAESHHANDPDASFGFYEEGSVCNGPSTCDHVMCVEYRCNGDVYTPHLQKVLIEANITLSGPKGYTCSVRELNPAVGGMIDAQPGHILFRPLGGYEFGPVYGVYSGTGTQTEMKILGQSYCQLGKNSGRLNGDENTENAVVYITCNAQ